MKEEKLPSRISCPPVGGVDENNDLKRVEFTITSELGDCLHEPGFVEDCSEVPYAIMRAVESYLEAHEGRLKLPINIRVQPSRSSPSC